MSLEWLESFLTDNTEIRWFLRLRATPYLSTSHWNLTCKWAFKFLWNWRRIKLSLQKPKLEYEEVTPPPPGLYDVSHVLLDCPIVFPKFMNYVITTTYVTHRRGTCGGRKSAFSMGCELRDGAMKRIIFLFFNSEKWVGPPIRQGEQSYKSPMTSLRLVLCGDESARQ